jgi:hypothetical protein
MAGRIPVAGRGATCDPALLHAAASDNPIHPTTRIHYLD